MTDITPAGGNARLPATYEAAQRALAECSRIDECKDWADKAQAMASYARQAKDSTLHNLALRIQNRAMRRAGELLKQIPRGDEATRYGQEGAHPPVTGIQDTTLPDAPPMTRTQAAEDAGLSEHQRKTALRIASVPAPQFDAAVERAAPPTVTQMAALGTVQRPQPIAAVPTIQPAASSEDARAAVALRLLSELASFCGTNDPVAVAHAIPDPDMARGFVQGIDAWLDRFVTHLPTDGEDASC